MAPFPTPSCQIALGARAAALAALLVALWTPRLTAQATFSGLVTDPEGEPIAGAVVTVSPLLDSVLRFQVKTDEEGRFRMENFNPSRGYRFRVVKEGFRSETRDLEIGLGGGYGNAVLDQEFTLFPIGARAVDREARLVLMTRQSIAVEPYKRGIRAFERGNLGKARQRLEEARDKDPELAPVHEALALLYHQLGEFEAGLEAAERALELSPWDPDYLRIRYEALKALGRQEEAREALELLSRAAADRSTAIFFYRDGVAAWEEGDLESAEMLIHTALRLEPEMLEAKDALAKVYSERRKYESALALSAEVLEDKPGDLQLLRMRQMAWSALGRTEESLAAIEELARLDPGPRTATLIYNQGVKSFNSGDTDTAETVFLRALTLDPDHLQSLLGMAEVYLRQERFPECLAVTEKVEALSPGNSHAQRIAERARAWIAGRPPPD